MVLSLSLSGFRTQKWVVLLWIPETKRNLWVLASESHFFSLWIVTLWIVTLWIVKTKTQQVQGKFEKTNIFDQLAVIREAELYNKWGPFVSKSTLLKYVHTWMN